MNVRTCFLCLCHFLLYLAVNSCSIFISVKVRGFIVPSEK